MYRILASILDGRDMHGVPKESSIHSLPCTSSDHNYPEFTGKETETLGGKVTQLGGIQVQSHGHEHRALLQVPGVCTLLLRCLPPAPTMNGTGYGKPSAPSQDPSPSPLKFPQASPPSLPTVPSSIQTSSETTLVNFRLSFQFSAPLGIKAP